MDWTHAFGIAASIGLVFGVVARVLPQVRNELVPRVAFVTTLLGNVVLLWGKFTAAAGVAAVGGDAHPVLLASFWHLPGIHQAVVFCGTIASTAVGLFLQRLTHEYGLKGLVGKQAQL